MFLKIINSFFKFCIYNINNKDIMIGINGLGRIGRLVLRASFENPRGIDIVTVNDPMMKPDEFRYLLTYDSAHLKFPFKVEKWDQGVMVNGKRIRLYSEMDPTKVPWGEHSVGTVLECTGKFLTT
jgi:glyceraldehyde 3-phosphate dehydrogenase